MDGARCRRGRARRGDGGPALARFAVASAALVGRELFLQRTAWPAHRDAVRLNDLIGLGVAILGILHAAARIALAVKRVHVDLLLVRAMLLVALASASEHEIPVPSRPLH